MNGLSEMAKKLSNKPELTGSPKRVIQALDENRYVYLTGPAGTGKSTILRAIKKFYKDKAALLATTGIAAVNLSGETFHSFFCIDILEDLDELKKSDLKNRFSKRFKSMEENLHGLEYIAIDEVSMMNSSQLRMILYRLKNYPRIKLLLIGDFPQLKSVTGRALYLSKTFTERFKVLKLRKQHRQASDPEFQKVLYNVRNSEVDEETKEFLVNLEDNRLEGAVNLRTTNKAVEEINELELSANPNELSVYSRLVTYRNNKVDKFVTDGILNSVREPLIFKYKIGARVLVTKNLKILNLYNGDMGTIESVSQDTLSIRLDRNGLLKQIKPIEYTHRIMQSGKTVEALRYRAYPLILGYALTIHKSQGLTLQKVDIDCSNMFESTMFYVALSRATTSEGVRLHNAGSLEFRKNRKLKLKWYSK